MSNSVSKTRDIWLVNLDSLGNIRWQKCLGGSNDEFSSSIIQTNDNGFLLGGLTASNDGDVKDLHGKGDMWIIKLDNNGEIEWQKCFGGSDNEKAECVIQTIDGGYAIAGYSSSNDGDVDGNHGNTDSWIIKLDSKGRIQWQKCLGGSRNDYGNSIIQMPDQSLIVGGFTFSNDGDIIGWHAGFNENNMPTSDCWITKLDVSSGDIQWQKCIGGSAMDYAYSLTAANDNGIIIAGSTSSNDGDVFGWHRGFTGKKPTYDFWVLKINKLGNIVWQKCIGDRLTEKATGIIATNENSYIIVGDGSIPNTESLGGLMVPMFLEYIIILKIKE